jgi:hypothetical protein
MDFSFLTMRYCHSHGEFNKALKMLAWWLSAVAYICDPSYTGGIHKRITV